MRMNQWRNTWLAAVAKLTGGTALAQLIGFVASLAYARIFMPEEMGLYALLLAVEGLLGSMLSLRYEAMIVVEPSPQRVLALCKLCLLLVLGWGAVAAVGCGLFCYLLRGYSPAVFVPLLALLWMRGTITVLESYHNRCGAYGLLSRVAVRRTLAQSLGALLFGWLGMGAWGLVLGHTLGLLCGASSLAKPLLEKRSVMVSISWPQMKELLHRYRRQARYSTPAAFANRLSQQLPVLLVETLFGASSLGLYTMTSKVLGLPIAILGGSVSKVFFREASLEAQQTGRFSRTFWRFSAGMLMIALLFVGVMWRFAPWIWSFVYGDAWARCGALARALLPLYGVRLVTNTVANGLQLAGRQRQELLLQLLMVLAVGCCGVMPWVDGRALEQWLMLVSVVMATCYGLIWLCVARAAHVTSSHH